MAKPSLEVARAPVAGAAVSAAVQQPGDPRPSLEEDTAITTAMFRPSRRLPTTPRARAISLPGRTRPRWARSARLRRCRRASPTTG